MAENAPLLYVNDTGPSHATRSELERLNPRRIVLLGGFDAVSFQLERSLRRDYPDVSRKAEPTPAFLASSLSAEIFPDRARVAYVVDAGDVAAAVVAPAVATNAGGPVLLTEAGLSHQTVRELERLNPRQVFVVGVAAERNDVAEALRTLNLSMHKLGGGDVHATASVAGKRNAAILRLDDNVNALHELEVLQPQHMVLVGSTAGPQPGTRELLEEVQYQA